jgi:hypothetical protein
MLSGPYSAYRVSLLGLLAWCWGWIAGHCGGYPAKVSGHASEHGDTGRIVTSVRATEADNTDLNIAVNEKRSATVSLQV